MITYIYVQYGVQLNLSILDTLNIRHLSNEDTCVQSKPHRAVYKSASVLETPFYTGQPTGPSGVLYREGPLSVYVPVLSNVRQTASFLDPCMGQCVCTSFASHL